MLAETRRRLSSWQHVLLSYQFWVIIFICLKLFLTAYRMYTKSVCVRVGGWVGMHSCVCLSAHLYEYPCTFFLFALMYLYVCFFAVVFGFVYANSVSKSRQHLRLSLHIQHVCLHMHLPCMHMLMLGIDFVLHNMHQSVLLSTSAFAASLVFTFTTCMCVCV